MRCLLISGLNLESRHARLPLAQSFNKPLPLESFEFKTKNKGQVSLLGGGNLTKSLSSWDNATDILWRVQNKSR